MNEDVLKQKAVGHARWLARQYGARGVVVLVFDQDSIAAVSYGETKAECTKLGEVLDGIMGGLQLDQAAQRETTMAKILKTRRPHEYTVYLQDDGGNDLTETFTAEAGTEEDQYAAALAAAKKMSGGWVRSAYHGIYGGAR